MNTSSLKPFSVVHYDYFFTILENIKYQIIWSCNDISFNTCGSIIYKVNALQYLPATIKVNVYYSEDNIQTYCLSDFMEKYPRENLNLKFNCHGWTFSNGHFLLMDHFIPEILRSEYAEVDKKKEHDIVVFKCLVRGTWIHSCKKEAQGYSHKDWIKGFYLVNDPSEILNMPQYANSELHYFRRKKRQCNLMCLRLNHGTSKLSLTH